MQKKSIKLARIDILIIVFCLVGAVIFSAAFRQEYFNTLVKNEEPVGEITFKKRSAQRKFIDRGMWDRLKQSSPVYNGDTIRTIEQSEAVVIFQDQVTYLTLDESTMIQIFFDNISGAKIDFSGGNMEVVSENKNIVISSGDSTIVLDGQARMNKNEEEFVLSVLEGQASFDETKIEAGNVLALDAKGVIIIKPVIVITSFGLSAYILSPPSEAVPVVFSWKSFHFESDTYVIVEVAEDRSFKNIIETREVTGASQVSIPLKSGNYWWRSYPAKSGGREPISALFPSGTLEIIPSAPAALLSPPDAAELAFSKETLVPLSWSAVEMASSYLVEISADADMSNPVVSRGVEKNSVTQSGLDYGRWYWRVTPVFPSQFRGSGISSQTGEFNVTKEKPVIAAPVLTYPLQNGRTSANLSAGRLLWNHDTNVNSWLVEVADNAEMNAPVVKHNVTNNYFSLSSNLLQDGKKWFWRVTALGGENPAVSIVYNFEVTAEKPPAPKPAPPAEAYIPPPPPVIFGANINNWDDLSADRKEYNERILLRIIALLDAHSGYRVRVEGHSNPLTHPGDAEARRLEQFRALKPLSEIRAKAVVDDLIKRGVDPNRLEFSGIGGENPLASWDDWGNWWKNRRAEFVLIKQTD